MRLALVWTVLGVLLVAALLGLQLPFQQVEQPSETASRLDYTPAEQQLVSATGSSFGRWGCHQLPGRGPFLFLPENATIKPLTETNFSFGVGYPIALVTIPSEEALQTIDVFSDPWLRFEVYEIPGGVPSGIERLTELGAADARRLEVTGAPASVFGGQGYPEYYLVQLSSASYIVSGFQDPGNIGHLIPVIAATFRERPDGCP